jgi:hypothetical protein
MANLGGFCGYRNIQVLAAHIIGTQTPGWEQFGDDIPSIFQIQDLVETAWDRGYNARGRVETGGIRGTRKYIGTPEVWTFSMVAPIVYSLVFHPRLKLFFPAWDFREFIQVHY